MSRLAVGLCVQAGCRPMCPGWLCVQAGCVCPGFMTSRLYDVQAGCVCPGWLYDVQGTYTLGYSFLAAMSLVCFVCVLAIYFIDRRNRRRQAATSNPPSPSLVTPPAMASPLVPPCQTVSTPTSVTLQSSLISSPSVVISDISVPAESSHDNGIPLSLKV